MLQTLRSFAHEQLQLHGELDECRERHARHFLVVAERIHVTLLRSPDEALVRSVARDHANFVSATQWSISSHQHELGVRLGAALWPYWFGRCLLADGRHLLEQILDASHNGVADSPRARALCGLAALMLRQEDVATGRETATRALHIAEEVGDLSATAMALFELGWTARVTGEPQQSRHYLERAGGAARAGADTFWNATSVEHLGILELHEGNLELGLMQLQVGVGLHRAARHTWGLAGGLLALARAQTALGKSAAARGALAESVGMYRALGDQLGLANCVDALAEVTISEGSPTLGVRLFGAADTLRQSVGIDATWSLEPTRVAALETLCVKLGRCRFDTELATGRAFATEDALAQGLAQSVERSPAIHTPPSPVTTPLSRREQEVAALIVQGNTNREIGKQLVITEWTVDTHVRHILTKLGLRSRVQVAAAMPNLRNGYNLDSHHLSPGVQR
jgi:non-specific serine/threonine protein kinase